MKTKRAALWKIGAVGLSGLLASLVGGQAFGGTIVGSAHDFSTSGWSGGQICVACHTPHNADTTVQNAPLWNHELTQQEFTLYSSGTLDATDIGQPAGSSILCLSCHDGTVALDSFGGFTGGTFMTGSAVVGLGGDLSDDHPISFTYDAALATTDGALANPTTGSITIGGGSDTRTGTIQEVLLISDQVQCSSCHDVHNTFTNGPRLLKIAINGSALCLTCHTK